MHRRCNNRSGFPLFLLCLGALSQGDAAAQSSLTDFADLPVIRHEIRGGTPLAKHLPATLLTRPGHAVPQRLAKLPPCREGRIRKSSVGAMSSLTSSAADLLVFSPSEKEQLSAAEKFAGQIVPYPSGAKYDPAAVAENPWLPFALTLDIRCLPTRFSFETEGATRFAVFREGDEALGSAAKHLLESEAEAQNIPRERDGSKAP